MLLVAATVEPAAGLVPVRHHATMARRSGSHMATTEDTAATATAARPPALPFDTDSQNRIVTQVSPS